MIAYQKYKEICNDLNHYPTDSELIYKYGLTRKDIHEIPQEKQNDIEYVKLI